MYRFFVVMLVLDDRIAFMNISGRAGSFVSILTQAIHGLFYDVVKRTTKFIIWPSCIKLFPQWFYFFYTELVFSLCFLDLFTFEMFSRLDIANRTWTSGEVQILQLCIEASLHGPPKARRL